MPRDPFSSVILIVMGVIHLVTDYHFRRVYRSQARQLPPGAVAVPPPIWIPLAILATVVIPEILVLLGILPVNPLLIFGLFTLVIGKTYIGGDHRPML